MTCTRCEAAWWAGGLLLVLTGCTTATVDVGQAHVAFTRVLTSTSFSVAPDGSIMYSSDPQAQAVADLVRVNAGLVRLMASEAGL